MSSMYTRDNPRTFINESAMARGPVYGAKQPPAAAPPGFTYDDMGRLVRKIGDTILHGGNGPVEGNYAGDGSSALGKAAGSMFDSVTAGVKRVGAAVANQASSMFSDSNQTDAERGAQEWASQPHEDPAPDDGADSMFNRQRLAAGSAAAQRAIPADQKVGDAASAVWNYKGIGRGKPSAMPTGGTPRTIQDMRAPMAGAGSMMAQPVAYTPRVAAPVAGAPTPLSGPQPVAGQATPSSAEAYIKALQSSLDADPAETAQERKSRLSHALLVGGLSMMSAASRPGATFLGSMGEGGLHGVADSKALEEERKHDFKEKRGNKLAVAKAGYDVSTDERKAGQEDRKIGQKDQEIGIEGRKAKTGEDTAAETGRYHRDQTKIAQQNADTESEHAKNPKSAMRDQEDIFDRRYRKANPKRGGETDDQYEQRVSDAVYNALTERKALPEVEENLKIDAALAKEDPMFQFDDPETQETKRQAKRRSVGAGGGRGAAGADSGGGTQGAPVAPTDTKKLVVGKQYSNGKGLVKTWTGTGWK